MRTRCRQWLSLLLILSHAATSTRSTAAASSAVDDPSSLQGLRWQQRRLLSNYTVHPTHARKLHDALPTLKYKVPLVTVPDLDADGIPTTFSWQEYLSMYPDVLEVLPDADERSAKLHYMQFGKREGRLPRLPPMLIQYTVCGSAIGGSLITMPSTLLIPIHCHTEQVYAHLHAWVVSARLGAGCVVPPGVVRPAPDTWRLAPPESIFDISATVRAARHIYLAMTTVWSWWLNTEKCNCVAGGAKICRLVHIWTQGGRHAKSQGTPHTGA